MNNLIKKLNKIEDDETSPFDRWSLDEIKQLLEIYYVISKKESHIFNLIYSYHGCDSWEDIFRDYDVKWLEDKANGVGIAIHEVMAEMDREQQK